MTNMEKIAELASIAQRIGEMSDSGGKEVQQAALVLLTSLAQQILKYATADKGE